MASRISQDKENLILQLNSNKLRPSLIAIQTQLSRKAIYNVLWRNGIDTSHPRFNFNRKYIVNDSFFKKIDSPQKAYWLGWIYSDGFVGYGKICLSLQERDKNILILLNKIIGSNHPLKYVTKVSPRQNQWRLTIKRINMINDLQRLGITHNKSKIDFPSLDILPKNLYCYFIRGFLDGDGCISEGYIPSRPHIYDFKVSFCCNKNFAKGLQSFFIEKKWKINIYKKSNTNKVVDVSFKHRHDIIKFLKWLYEKRPEISLERKRTKAMHILNYWKKSLSIKQNP